ncbi:MAG TPA: hypothetical protein VGM98_18300, partial [Schlesneria sp.]
SPGSVAPQNSPASPQSVSGNVAGGGAGPALVGAANVAAGPAAQDVGLGLVDVENVAEAASPDGAAPAGEAHEAGTAVAHDDAAAPQTERWLHYRRELNDGSNVGISLLLPQDDTLWLTPQMSTLDGLLVTSPTEAVLIAKGIWLKKDSSIRIFSARGTIGDASLAKLNGDWKLTKDSDGETIAIDITGLNLPAGQANAFGGTWFSIDPRPTDQRGVHYQQEVERVAVVLAAWKSITAVAPTASPDEWTLTVPASEVAAGDRMLFRRADLTTVDYGTLVPTEHQNDPPIQPELTVLVKSVTADKVVVVLPAAAQSQLPQVGWQIAPSLELAPTWSDRNRLKLLSSSPPSEESQNEYLSLTQGAAMWAGTAANAGQDVAAVNRSTYQVVFDGRLELDDPRFTVVPDGAVNPPGVLSTRLRELETIDLIGADQVLESAARYENARRDLVRQELHEALDLNDDDTLRQTRAQSAQLLLHRLTDKPGVEDSNDAARLVDFTEANDTDRWLQFGWLWKTDRDRLQEVHVRRAGRKASKV